MDNPDDNQVQLTHAIEPDMSDDDNEKSPSYTEQNDVEKQEQVPLQTTSSSAADSDIPRIRTFYDYFFVFAIGQIYTFSYFLRKSLAPITDVLEDEFHATGSQVGLCSSLLLGGYFIMQIPAGMILQIYSCEFISLLCALAMGAAAGVFSFSPNIQIATAAQLISGIAQAPMAISVLSVIGNRMGNYSVAFVFGLVKLYAYFVTIGLQYVQAYIYEEYAVWKPMFYGCSIGCVLISLLTFIALCLESKSVSYQKVQTDTVKEEIGVISMQKLQSYSQSGPLSDDYATPPSQSGPLSDDYATSPSQSGPLSDDYATPPSKCKCFPIKNEKQKNGSSNSVMTSFKYSLKNYINYIFAGFGFLLIFVLYGFYGLWLISYLMLKFDYERPTATLICSSFYVASAFSGTLYGYFSTRLRRRKIFLMSAPILMATSLIIVYVNDSMNMFVIIICCIISGCGFGGQNSVFWATVRENNAYFDCIDISVGMINSMTNAGGFVAQYLIGILMDVHWEYVRGGVDTNSGGDRRYSVQDYDFAFMTLPICLLGSFLLSFFVRETYCKAVDYS